MVCEKSATQVVEKAIRLGGFEVILDARCRMHEVIVFRGLGITKAVPAGHGIDQAFFGLRDRFTHMGRKLVAGLRFEQPSAAHGVFQTVDFGVGHWSSRPARNHAFETEQFEGCLDAGREVGQHDLIDQPHLFL